ncbi:hypothetical protein TrLO_g2000 [Triparma laevis f. longispina]|uniref:Uncharacterized protein n=1 Tax=Triparma laevis f. longispina TaxID=1714387 RepID=A0A9W7AEM6_9STRA|nr:hypothetical protein TrLO_g2000 [Triparma laevis f. longispina]
MSEKEWTPSPNNNLITPLPKHSRAVSAGVIGYSGGRIRSATSGNLPTPLTDRLARSTSVDSSGSGNRSLSVNSPPLPSFDGSEMLDLQFQFVPSTVGSSCISHIKSQISKMRRAGKKASDGGFGVLVSSVSEEDDPQNKQKKCNLNSSSKPPKQKSSKKTTPLHSKMASDSQAIRDVASIFSPLVSENSANHIVGLNRPQETPKNVVMITHHYIAQAGDFVVCLILSEESDDRMGRLARRALRRAETLSAEVNVLCKKIVGDVCDDALNNVWKVNLDTGEEDEIGEVGERETTQAKTDPNNGGGGEKQSRTSTQRGAKQRADNTGSSWFPLLLSLI